MNKILIIFCSLFLFSSCQKTNDFYSDINDSSKEKIDLKIEGYDLSVSAIKYGNSLEITLYIKSNDKSEDIEYININYYPELIQEKKVFFTDETQILKFNNFSDIQRILNYKISNKQYVILYYKYTDPKMFHIDDLNFSIELKTNSKTEIENIQMKKHSRYKIW